VIIAYKWNSPLVFLLQGVIMIKYLECITPNKIFHSPFSQHLVHYTKNSGKFNHPKVNSALFSMNFSSLLQQSASQFSNSYLTPNRLLKQFVTSAKSNLAPESSTIITDPWVSPEVTRILIAFSQAQLTTSEVYNGILKRIYSNSDIEEKMKNANELWSNLYLLLEQLRMNDLLESLDSILNNFPRGNVPQGGVEELTWVKFWEFDKRDRHLPGFDELRVSGKINRVLPVNFSRLRYAAFVVIHGFLPDDTAFMREYIAIERINEIPRDVWDPPKDTFPERWAAWMEWRKSPTTTMTRASWDKYLDEWQKPLATWKSPNSPKTFRNYFSCEVDEAATFAAKRIAKRYNSSTMQPHLIENLKLILEVCCWYEATQDRQVAVILACAHYISRLGHPFSIDEKYDLKGALRSKSYFNDKYGDGNPASRNKLGNRAGTDDDFNYRRRGFAPFIGRDLYLKYNTILKDWDKLKTDTPQSPDFIDLVKNPDQASNSIVAAHILVNMIGGMFSKGHKDNVLGTSEASKLIDDDAHASEINNIANYYLTTLLPSKSPYDLEP
jgi:hypothetical protein